MDLTREWYRSEFINQEMLNTHRKIENEMPFYNAIAEGNLEFVMNNCDSKVFTNMQGMGKLSEDSVQNIRYHFVVTAALIIRFCIYAGLEQEKAYGLSDFYIQQMDKLGTVDEISVLHDAMCIDICRQMQEIKKSHILSKPIVLCLDYIYSHVHERLTIKELAAYLELSESYLSKLFKKEMGMPVSEYIISLKIKKAKNLLQYSDKNIVDIANYLSFSSQSHFIQVFKMYEGITPYKYRMTHYRSHWELGV